MEEREEKERKRFKEEREEEVREEGLEEREEGRGETRNRNRQLIFFLFFSNQKIRERKTQKKKH